MNEKTRTQIEEMKKQTIGVEVEMNNIDRSRRQKSPPSSLAPGATRAPHTATGTAPGAHGTARDASGNSRRTFPFPVRTAKNASWSPQS